MLQQYCQTKSLAPFDANGDGFVDGLFLVHAGGGAEAEPNATKRKDMIWSHKWTLPTAFVNNGVQAFAYFTAPEDGQLGVFAHEFGHFLGLPDLYDTSYRSFGIGDWCLMAGGSWNGNGKQPARMSAWCLATLGWIKPKNVGVDQARCTLRPLETDKTACYRLWTRRQGLEGILPDREPAADRDATRNCRAADLRSGTSTRRSRTTPIRSPTRSRWCRRTGSATSNSTAIRATPATSFPGSKGVTKLDDKGAAHPHTRKNDGTATGVALSKIKVSKGVVDVTVKVYEVTRRAGARTSSTTTRSPRGPPETDVVNV